jgi:tetratricopeptide (TPR) repeat protein
MVDPANVAELFGQVDELRTRLQIERHKALPELDGLMAVLAPTVLEQPRAFAESVLALVRAPALRNVRFVVIEIGDALAKPLVEALGDAAMTNECAVDPMQYRREASEALAASAAAPVGASPEVAAGGAGPKDVIAPPRFGKPPRDAAFSPEQEALLASELGPAVALLGASGALLRQRIAGAALALQELRFGAAIALQGEACTQCLEAGLVRFACILEVTLAAYLLHAGDPARSRGAFEKAAARAEAAGLFDVAAQALLGLAAVLVLLKDLEGSIAQYARAGELAAKGDSPLLAIEAYRTAGQIALRAHAESAAVAAWTRALALANASPPEVVAQSSASTVARALAKVMQERGSFTAAESLLAQADEYERRDLAGAADDAAPGESAPVGA